MLREVGEDDCKERFKLFIIFVLFIDGVSDIIRKIKLIKIILDNLISENAKSLKDIQNTMNNYNSFRKKDNDYFELIKERNLQPNDKKILKSYIEKSLKQYSNYMDIAKSIREYCEYNKEGKWSVIVGERDKYNFSSYVEQDLVSNIGPYKITIIYNC